MRRLLAWGCAAVLVSALGTEIGHGADAPGLKSGLQVGEPAPAFQVQDITGPNKGSSLCYR